MNKKRVKLTSGLMVCMTLNCVGLTQFNVIYESFTAMLVGRVFPFTKMFVVVKL